MNGIASRELHDHLPSVDLVLIDDDKLTIEIVSWILKDTEISNKLFTDSELARGYLNKHSASILVVDYYMPQINGFELISELLEHQALEHTSIFLCSAVTPYNESPVALERMGIQLLEKQAICDRETFLELISSNLSLDRSKNLLPTRQFPM